MSRAASRFLEMSHTTVVMTVRPINNHSSLYADRKAADAKFSRIQHIRQEYPKL